MDLNKIQSFFGEQNFYKDILNQSSEGIAISDMDGNYLYVNPGFCLMSGFSEEELLKMTVFDVKAKSQPQTSFFESKTDLEGLPLQVNLIKKDGTEYLTEIIGNVIKINGKDCVLGTVRLAAHRSIAETIIHNKNNELQLLNAAKDKFFSIIAHDLRNPFGCIIGLTNLLIVNSEKYDQEKIKKFASTINHAATNTFNLLENLLEWARLQQGLIKPLFDNLNLKQVVDEVILLYDDIAQDKHIAIHSTVNTAIESNCDVWMTKTILRNLISNAIKFSHKESVVNISAVVLNDFITICVNDTGVCIDAEKFDQLFEIGNSISTIGTANEKGTGIGLSLCKELVEKQGGGIWLESEINVGTNFYFTLPCKK